MKSLDPVLIESLAARLRGRHAELLAQIARTRSVEDDTAAATAGEVTDQKEQAGNTVRQSLQDATLRLEQQELSRVQAALGRMADGKYGSCTDCECPIGAERLAVVPAALRCRDCQARFEARRLQNIALGDTGNR